MKSRALTLSVLAATLGLSACGARHINLYDRKPEETRPIQLEYPKYNSIPPEDRIGLLYLEVDGAPDIIIVPQDPLMFIEALPFYRLGIETVLRIGYTPDQVASALRRGLISRERKCAPLLFSIMFPSAVKNPKT